MTEHGQTTPTTGGPGPLAQPALALPAHPWAARPRLPRRPSGILPAASGAHAFVTALAVIALLVAAWASFAGLQEGGVPSVTPTAFAHGAVSGMLEASPAPSPVAGDTFRSYIPIGRCLLNPKPVAQVQELLGEEREWPERDLSAASTPPADDAIAAAEAARAFEACWQQAGTTDRFIWMQQSRFAGPYEERWAQQSAEGREASRHLDVQPADLWIETSQEPNATQAQNPIAYLPEHAVRFPDGSIGIPASFLVWEGDPTWVDEAPDPLYTLMVLLVEEDGAWLVDALLPVCVGDCQEFIDGGPWHSSPVRDFTALTPTPAPTAGSRGESGPLVDLTPTPGRRGEAIKSSGSIRDDISSPTPGLRGGASPDSSPVGMDAWLTWVQPEECDALPMPFEEYAAIMRQEPDISDRSYEPTGRPDRQTAEAVASAARAREACLSSARSRRYAHLNRLPTSSPGPHRRIAPSPWMSSGC